MKNSGPEPIHATDPLLILGHASICILLNVTPWASIVPWINAKGGPKGAYMVNIKNLGENNET